MSTDPFMDKFVLAPRRMDDNLEKGVRVNPIHLSPLLSCFRTKPDVVKSNIFRGFYQLSLRTDPD